MKVRFIVRKCHPQSMYREGEGFGVFETDNLSGAKRLKNQIESIYGLRVDYYVYN